MDTLTNDITLELASPDHPGVRAILDAHFALMRSQSPEESCHVLPADGLKGATLVAAKLGETILGVGAFQALDGSHTELKSMHTLAASRGKGVGRLILEDLMQRARADGFEKMSLETGSAAEFAAARALYAAHGFTICPPFGDYTVDPLSVFMTRAL